MLKKRPYSRHRLLIKTFSWVLAIPDKTLDMRDLIHKVSSAFNPILLGVDLTLRLLKCFYL